MTLTSNEADCRKFCDNDPTCVRYNFIISVAASEDEVFNCFTYVEALTDFRDQIDGFTGSTDPACKARCLAA